MAGVESAKARLVEGFVDDGLALAVLCDAPGSVGTPAMI